MIRWTKDYSLNIEHLDKEHQSLFEALNNFYEGVKNNSTSESLAALIDELTQYAQTHFKNEEDFMRKINFPRLDSHIKEHQMFMEKVDDFVKKFKAGEIPASFEITHFIMDWITRHIKREDMQYAMMAGKK